MNPEEFAEQGINLSINGDLDGTIQLFDKALEINPNNEESKKWRNECYLRLNQISSYFYHYFSLKLI